MSKKECNICLGERTNFIKCGYCEMEACNDCQQKYILEKTIPGCMNCKKEWSYNWIREHFPKHFMNKTYKNVKENQLFEIEKTMLPGMQSEVSFEMKYSEELEFYQEYLRRIQKCKNFLGISEDEIKKNDLDEIKEMYGFYKYKSEPRFFGKDIYQVWKKWNEEEDKKKKDYIQSEWVFISWKSEMRLYKSIIKDLKKVIESKVDLKVLQEIFGNMYHTWNIKYNVKTNVIVGNLYFQFKIPIWDKYVYRFIKKFFDVEVTKGEEYKENEIVNPIFNVYLDEEGKTIFEFLDKDYVFEKQELKDFLMLNCKNKKSNFSRPCPKNDCRGFFDNRWKCGLCEVTVCKNCHEVLEENHTCNPDTVKSVKAMERETKPCPKCNILTYKISGCQQIWCTQCHTTWDWESGEIEKGRIHNPHYWEFLRQQGKEDDEVKRQFGEGERVRVEQPTCFNFNSLERYLNGSSFNFIFQVVNHLELHDLPKFKVENMEELNYSLRKDYLKQKIDDKKFKSQLSMRFKRNNFNMEARQIIEMYLQTLKDTVTIFFQKERDIQKVPSALIKYLDTSDLYKNIINLQEYVINNLKKIYEIYGYVLPYIESLQPEIFSFFDTSKRDIVEMKRQDLKRIEQGLNFLIDLDYNAGFTKNYTVEYTKYGIRNPLHFYSEEHYLKYKEDKINKWMDMIEQIKSI